MAMKSAVIVALEKIEHELRNASPEIRRALRIVRQFIEERN